MNNPAKFSTIPAPQADATEHLDAKAYEDALNLDKERQHKLELDKQNMGWLGKFFGRSTDTANFGRDVILGGLIVLAITGTHMAYPEHSALIPALTGLLGFIGGSRYSSQKR